MEDFKFTLDFKDAWHTEEDLRLSLLAGATIKLGNLKIEPYSLKEIIDMGYSKYLQAIRMLTMTMADFEEVFKSAEGGYSIQQLSKFQELEVYTPFYMYLYFAGEQFRKYLIEGLKVVFKTDDIQIYEGKPFLSIGQIEDLNNIDPKESLIIDNNNFDRIVKIMKLQNYLDINLGNAISEEGNPADEETRKLLEFQKKIREKMKRLKNSSKNTNGVDDDAADFSSLVSAVTTKSNHINKTNVWGMTLYQVYDEFNRLIMIDDYETNIKAVMAGAKDVEITHWSFKPILETE